LFSASSCSIFLARLVLAETARTGQQTTTVEFDDACRDALEKTPIVSDEHQRHPRRHQHFLQPFDGADVEMVGRLIEQQQLRRDSQRLRQRQALLLATGKRSHQRVGVEREALDDPLGLRLERPGIRASSSVCRSCMRSSNFS
jgi:hypothetical protein